jgi:lipopolysaccharide transport system permease protein
VAPVLRATAEPRQAENTAAAPVPSRRSVKQFGEVLRTLTEADLRARYGRGPWRLVKWLMDPFAVVGVYLVLVSVLIDRPGRAPGLSLACAVVPFQLAMMTVINALDAIRIRRAIVANMAFPRALIPVASAVTESLAFAASLILLALMMAVYAVAPTAAMLWLPVVLLTTVVFAVAIAYPATLVGVWMPDARPFVISMVRAAFFLAPGLIALDQITGTARDLVRINPLSGLFEAYRSVVLEGTAPALWELGVPLAFAALVAAVFVPIFRREEGQFAKVVE